MTTLTASQFTQPASRPRAPGLASVTARVVDVFSVMAAAIRVAGAVESRRDPADADLKTLGISGPLPKAW